MRLRGLLFNLLAVAVAAVVGVGLVPSPAMATDVRAGQWQLDALNINKVHKITTGSGVVVGLLDSGVYARHPDLSGRILKGSSITGAGSSDGWGDDYGHGTAMAGDIVAKGGGDDHALGIAPGAKILPVRVSNDGDASDGNIARGVRWATNHGASVINISLGRDGLASKQLQNALKFAMRKDVVVVGSAGNTTDGDTDVTAPANYPGVIAVAGTSKDGSAWEGSVQGNSVALSAPADGVVSTGSTQAGNETGYVKGEGTSDSAAFVSGAAALIRSKYPKMKAPDVINHLIKTADDAGPSGWDRNYGFGELNIVKALTKDVSHVSQNPLITAQEGNKKTTAASPGTSADAVGSSWGKGDGGNALWSALVGFLALVVLVVLLLLYLSWRKKRRLAQVPAGPGGGYRMPPGGSPYGPPPYGGPPSGPAGPGGGQFGGPPAPGQFGPGQPPGPPQSGGMPQGPPTPPSPPQAPPGPPR